MASCTTERVVLKYAPFTSSVEIGFWHQFTKHKLEDYKLSTEPVEITGSYVNTDDAGLMPRLSVSYNAFSSPASPTTGVYPCPGLLLHTNTVEEFRSGNRRQLLADVARERLWRHLVTGRAASEPGLLATFVLHLFADLKKYHYKYWFAFPAHISHTETLLAPPLTLGEAWTPQQTSSLLACYSSRPDTVHGGFFVLERPTDNSFVCHPLTEYQRLREQGGTVLLCVADPSTVPGVPGWPLRNLLSLAFLQWPSPRTHTVLCLRQRARRGERSAADSLLLQVLLEPRTGTLGDDPPCVGWEKDPAGNLAPITLDLSKTMDPEKVSDSACELTLQLMRWRVAPDLDIPKMQATKCLLLGAGTLGCNVARALLGWGVNHITFVDSGRVSYSNPVRQSLYSFADCASGGREKAATAAQALKLVRPSVVSRGVSLTIPMPGHPPGPSQRAAVLEAVQQLQQLVQQHDVVFLLTDSRESRWLPSIVGAAMNKVVITAALGFDSFLVIRHGSKSGAGNTATQPQGTSCSVDCSITKVVPGNELGCYFCNDVVVPRNSQKDRTLDQQCTVSRPGVSMMAAGEAVELMAAVLQHPLGVDAPSGPDSSEGVLGSVPHSVRYFLATHQLITPTMPSFRQCSACGDQMLSHYHRDGSAMLLKVFDCADALEELSGIAALRKQNNLEDIEDFPDTYSLSEEDDF